MFLEIPSPVPGPPEPSISEIPRTNLEENGCFLHPGSRSKELPGVLWTPLPLRLLKKGFRLLKKCKRGFVEWGKNGVWGWD
jgi:hypothetical protein